MGVIETLRSLRAEMQLPAAAKRERAADRSGLTEIDPGPERVIQLGVAWLGLAQDQSTTRDGGVARDYSLIRGWASSYPETTGYIVPTLLDYARAYGRSEYRERAQRMLDWFVAIQLPDGGFQGGKIDSQPIVPVTFNTGQILLGLAAGAAEFDKYRSAMRKAADWLVATQDSDGCWRRFATPFAESGEKAYETHVAWGLFEAARVEPNTSYANAAMANVRWALSKQQQNGWVADCCLDDPIHPLTHTLGYFLRGVLEAYRFSKDPTLLIAARRTADALLSRLETDGRLPGRFDANWQPCVDWVCLTGTVQIAHSWLLLFRFTGEAKYRDAAFRANAFVRRTVKTDGPPETRGAVKGSFPVVGDYGIYQYLNWAVKFCVDAQIEELRIRAEYP